MAEKRFGFGKNWELYLASVDEPRIERAEASLKEMLGVVSLEGKTFLDAGCGSGLFSLAAARLGAEVRSFDYDAASVECALRLRDRYFPGGAKWSAERGDVLDGAYMAGLGRYDVVYSWGVLHHTGEMWKAIDAVAGLTRAGGTLFIAIYNDQGLESRIWKAVKVTYNSLPEFLRPVISALTFLRFWSFTILKDTFKGRPFRAIREYRANRGMSVWRDVVDWAGGYPFEVARPEEISGFLAEKGFSLVRQRLSGGSGCNEYVFLRRPGG